VGGICHDYNIKTCGAALFARQKRKWLINTLSSVRWGVRPGEKPLREIHEQNYSEENRGGGFFVDRVLGFCCPGGIFFREDQKKALQPGAGCRRSKPQGVA